MLFLEWIRRSQAAPAACCWMTNGLGNSEPVCQVSGDGKAGLQHTRCDAEGCRLSVVSRFWNLLGAGAAHYLLVYSLVWCPANAELCCWWHLPWWGHATLSAVAARGRLTSLLGLVGNNHASKWQENLFPKEATIILPPDLCRSTLQAG